ncbi:MAG: hypothetical protein V2I24_15750 [Halieaceae bacterium]|jgi:tetratricopeptide (TPR) repeat protein|nr:hypothetical protein [Halieaceae bacterium]
MSSTLLRPGNSFQLLLTALLISVIVVHGSGASTILHHDSSLEPDASSAALQAILDAQDLTFGAGEYEGRGSLTAALARGNWAEVCAMATDVLALRQPDLDALGLFTICAALRNDRAILDPALAKLRDVEPLPHIYTDFAEGIRQLMDEEPEIALDTFSRVRNRERDRPAASIFTGMQPGTPGSGVHGQGAVALANYFRGEALFALGREQEAAGSFRASLRDWPEYAPALAAGARLTAGADASPEALATAIAMTERATRIEPTNLGYWRQLADLCERNGETGRASAIRLQWLTPRYPQ